MNRDILNQATKEKHILSIYTDQENTDKFSAGFIQAVSDDYILIAHVTPFGQNDGYVTKRLGDIYKIEYLGKYETRLETLYSIQGQSHDVIDCKTDNIIFAILQFALNNHFVVSIELFNSGCNDIQGIITKTQENELTIKIINDDGEENGIGIIRMEDITNITCNSDNEKAIKLLYNKVGEQL